MEAALIKQVDALVDCGWEPRTTTETSASLTGRRPFSWWLFLLVIIFFPIFGGVVYLIFWLLTSKATVFLHMDNGEVAMHGDIWLVRIQEAQREASVEEHKAIKEQGFLAVMWPKLVVFLLLLLAWVWLLRWYF